jgi:spore photoproduct lyase
VEEAARDNPRTQAILKRFPSSQVIPIDDYQNVFGRGRQDFWKQKASPKLILAVKKENFMYSGNDFLQGNALPNFTYTALVLNCPYDCHYCYLQGMYGGANLVVFVNLEDYFLAAKKAFDLRPSTEFPMPLALSYDTDLLALEGLLGFAREWTEWAREQKDVVLEIRTKSAAGRFLEEVEPADNVHLAWTLSPDEIARRYEQGAPSLEKRIQALNRALERGWKVRLCLDPLLRIPQWKEHYQSFAAYLGEAVALRKIEHVELGVFRVSPGYFKRMIKRPQTDLLHYPYEHANNAVSYKKLEREELVSTLQSALSGFLSKDKFHIWT